jgi:hypothetical protein
MRLLMVFYAFWRPNFYQKYLGLTLNDHVTAKSMEVKKTELHLNNVNTECGFSVGKPWKLLTHPESVL